MWAIGGAGTYAVQLTVNVPQQVNGFITASSPGTPGVNPARVDVIFGPSGPGPCTVTSIPTAPYYALPLGVPLGYFSTAQPWPVTARQMDGVAITWYRIQPGPNGGIVWVPDYATSTCRQAANVVKATGTGRREARRGREKQHPIPFVPSRLPVPVFTAISPKRIFFQYLGQLLHQMVRVGAAEDHGRLDLEDVVVGPVGADEHAQVAHAVGDVGCLIARGRSVTGSATSSMPMYRPSPRTSPMMG